MSSSKRRKLEPQETPSPAVSALSALAARRRLAAGSPAEAAPSTPSRESAPARSNAFSALQMLKGREHKTASQIQGTESAKRESPRTPQRRGDAQRVAAATATNDQGDKLESISAKASPLKVIQYSSFRPTKRNHKVKTGGITELRLEESERFLVLGSFGIRVLAGQATVTGATLRPSDTIYWVHAPHCHAIPVIRTAEHTNLELHQDSVVGDLRLLGRLSPLFRRIWNGPVEDWTTPLHRSAPTFKILCTSEDAPRKSPIQDLVSPPEWNKVLATLVSVATQTKSWACLVCGPKSAGKSTFSRLLTNRLLTMKHPEIPSLVILDLDPGQPEYSPAGTLSLVEVMAPNLGTPFTHPGLSDSTYRVIRCHAIASVTPASAPELYLQCATDLLETWRQTFSHCPLVVNTPGWIQGTGLDLLTQMIETIHPHQVVYLSEEGPLETVEALERATKQTFTTIPSNQAEFTSRTAAHFRSMQTMSYFHSTSPKVIDSSSRSSWNSSPLCTMPPWRVRYSGPQRGILAVISYDYQPLPQLLADAINGMILAAVEIEDDRAFAGFETGGTSPKTREDGAGSKQAWPKATSLVSYTPEGIPYISNLNDVALAPQYSRCLGLILVRGVDTKSRELHVITPIPAASFEDVKQRGKRIALVHGKFDAPTWAYTEELYERSDQEVSTEKEIEVVDGDTSEDDSEAEPEHVEDARDVTETPWVEVLTGDEKRPIGSKVWRVRRDLGRNSGP